MRMIKNMNQSSQLDLKKSSDLKFVPVNIFRLQVGRLVQEFCLELGVNYQQLKFRSMTSRWGTCSSKGVITINTKLKNLPQDLIKFVVYHECLHLMHMNHGVNFKKRMAKKFANKKELEHQLKLYGLSEK